MQNRTPAYARGMCDAAGERYRAFTDEIEQREDLLKGGYGCAAEAFEHWPRLRQHRRGLSGVLRDKIQQLGVLRAPTGQPDGAAVPTHALGKSSQYPHTDGVERLDTRAVDDDLR